MKYLLPLFLFLSSVSFAQDQICGTEPLPDDPLEGISFKTADDDAVYDFKIFFTVLYTQPSDTVALHRQWLHDELAIMNTYFRLLNTDMGQVPEPYRSLATDAKITFTWAGVRYVRSGNTAFPTFQSFFDAAQGGIPAFNPQNTINYYYAPYTWSTGVAIFPNSSVIGQPYHGAITRLSAALQSVGNHYTAWVNVHELGHLIGLYHTFQDACNEVNCATAGDRVCDTPPCITGNTCANLASGCAGVPSANRHNHMDYSDRIVCAKMFTKGQVEKMRSTVLAYYRNHIGVTPPNQPPTCRIISPRDTTVAPNTFYTVTVSAIDDSRVNFVDLHIELGTLNNEMEVLLTDNIQVVTDTVNYGTVVYRFTAPPYSIGIRPMVEQKYIWHAHATDDSGMTTTSQTVTVTVRNAPQVQDSPVIRTTHKANGSLEFESQDGRKKIIP